MAVVSQLKLQLKVTDNTFSTFDTGPYNSTVSSFTQLFQADILVEDSTADRPISLQGVGRAQQIFLWSDQPVEIKLVPYGSSLLQMPVGLTLLPKVPSLLSVQNIIEIYVSNNSGQQARLILQGAGINP